MERVAISSSDTKRDFSDIAASVLLFDSLRVCPIELACKIICGHNYKILEGEYSRSWPLQLSRSFSLGLSFITGVQENLWGSDIDAGRYHTAKKRNYFIALVEFFKRFARCSFNTR